MSALSSEIVLVMFFLNVHASIISQKEVSCQAPKIIERVDRGQR